MRVPRSNSESWWKFTVLAGLIGLTVSIHYGWILAQIFGHTEWVHAIHGRLCYIPIVMAAAWFGLRGGIAAATAITVLVLPLIFFGLNPHTNVSSELTEIVFYFTIGALIGLLIDRETRIQRKHEETVRQLERSHHLSIVGRMAAGVAHEIKNPLASIKGAVEIINSPATSKEERREFQEIVASEVNRIDGTVKEFLEFARPKEFETKRVDLSTLVVSAAKQMESQMHQRQLKLVTDIQDQINVDADAERIHQVTLNLLLNAIEASSAGSTITVSLTANSDRRAVLSICDQGKGIEEDEIGRIFDPFFTTKSTGTGLGLAIVQTIVERHGGTITVDSQLKKGTCFIVSLPMIGAKQ